ncbi:hypothetical protein [Dactylosporangium sp. CA-139066]|uniref:hypothetical protein n=1 Tax=Dactylosporangium sp. CA-139066 TaxID=3239930 RepID=UPI003D8AA780
MSRLLMAVLTAAVLVVVAPQAASATPVYLHMKNVSVGACVVEIPGDVAVMTTCNSEWDRVFEFQTVWWNGPQAVYIIKSRNGNCLDTNISVLTSGACNGTRSQQWIGVTQPNGSLVLVNNYARRCLTAQYNYWVYVLNCSTWTNGVAGTPDQQFEIF